LLNNIKDGKVLTPKLGDWVRYHCWNWKIAHLEPPKAVLVSKHGKEVIADVDDLEVLENG